ncbi:hypothetical protein Tco_0415690 [Tanacetum coccineum]
MIFSGKLKSRLECPFTITKSISYGNVELSHSERANFKVNGSIASGHYFGGTYHTWLVQISKTLPQGLINPCAGSAAATLNKRFVGGSHDCPDCEDSQFCHSSRVSHPQLHLESDILILRTGSGYQQKDRKPSQNDKTEHGNE